MGPVCRRVPYARVKWFGIKGEDNPALDSGPAALMVGCKRPRQQTLTYYMAREWTRWNGVLSKTAALTFWRKRSEKSPSVSRSSTISCRRQSVTTVFPRASSHVSRAARETRWPI